ncbi:hypothetical protein ACIB24_19010 [Spongisporangium articulatum]|uniref:Uncharacterized protein n=1 Tax=Spongisporangium articulatum TaxID=3362603 RepID=A0ABW8ARZ2_9ACTN
MDDPSTGEWAAEGQRAQAARERASELSRRAVRAGKWSEAVAFEAAELKGHNRARLLRPLSRGGPEPAVEDLWVAYVECGGNTSIGELADFLEGRASLPPLERAILQQAVQEVLQDAGSGS